MLRICKKTTFFMMVSWVIINMCNAQDLTVNSNPGSITSQNVLVDKCQEEAVRIIVKKAVKMKKRGCLETTIVDSLYYQSLRQAKKEAEIKAKNNAVNKDKKEKQKNGKNTQPKENNGSDKFGSIILNCNEIMALKEAGFNDDFLAKIEGHPEYFSVGISTIWFAESDDIGFASMLRIFLKPKSFFDIKSEYFPHPFYHLSSIMDTGFFQGDRYDLNLGLTTTVKTQDNDDFTNEKEKNSYFLIGISHELHRYAFVNLGLAYSPGCDTGHKKQFYIGLTVDYNLLKAIGLAYK